MIDQILKDLFPLNRSLSGEDNRKTLAYLQNLIPLRVLEFPSGTSAFDWTIPPEWNCRGGWIRNSHGEKLIDFEESNLHIMSYSVPVHKTMSLEELKPHLHYLENLPEAIPYRTTYYKRNWGVCVTYNQFQEKFSAGDYEVFIDSELNERGSLVAGEILVPGKSKKEILISTYFCHPSLANDNLSGVVLTALLGRELMQRQNYYTYRILFLPETIGPIAYGSRNPEILKKAACALVVTTVGGPGKLGYKQCFDPKHRLNSLVEMALSKHEPDFITYPFDVHGSDERQYSSPGFRIPSVSITKDKYYEYPYYHTSLDNLDFVRPEALEKSYRAYLDLMDILEKDLVYQRVEPHGEVMLSKHGLYPDTGGALIPGRSSDEELDTLLNFLFEIDGNTSLVKIAEKLNIPVNDLSKLAATLNEAGILKEAEEEG